MRDRDKAWLAGDRWMEALLGARLRFHAGPEDGDFDPTRLTYWGRVYRRWSQLYHWKEL